MPPCRSPIGSICRGSGSTIRRAAPRRMFRARSRSRPSRRLRWRRSARLCWRGVLPVRKDNPKPPRVSVEALALSLPKHAWRTITWREGTNEKLQSRFARVRVRVAPIRGDVDIAKLRWRIERDYHDLKQEIGLGHYEGRGWRGFHHHGTLSIAAYGFLISERERIPPSAPHSAARIEKSAVPSGYRPRGAPDPAATPRPQLDRNDPAPVGCRDCNDPSTMPVLHPS